MTCILIDDEKESNKLLSIMITRYCPSLHIMGIYEDPIKACDAIHDLKPDLVFLDIEMPELDGFGVLEKCRDIPFETIFITAHTQFAIKAFRFSAIDYLLKPIDVDDLIDAIKKADNQKNAHDILQQRDIFINYLSKSKPSREKIALPTQDGLTFVKVKTIIYCESSGNYTNIYVEDSIKPLFFTKSLKEIEEILIENMFYRVHNSFLINLKQINRYSRNDGGEVIMTNGKAIPISRQKKQEFLDILSHLYL